MFDADCTNLCRDTRRDTSVLARMENIDDDCKLNDIIFVKVNLNIIPLRVGICCMYKTEKITDKPN